MNENRSINTLFLFAVGIILCFFPAETVTAQTAEDLFQSVSIPELYLESNPQDAERFLNWRIHSDSTSPVTGAAERDQPFSVSGFMSFNEDRMELQEASFAPFYQRYPTEKKRSFRIHLTGATSLTVPRTLWEMEFDAIPHDPSLLRTALAWELARRFEIPGPRTTHVKVYLNDQYIGVYLLKEVVNEEFVADRFGSRSGILYKGNEGADLRSRGSDPTLYSHPQNGIQTYEIIHNGSQNDYQELASFIRFLNTTSSSEFEQQIRDRFDVEAYLRVLAYETLLGNWDGYRFNQQNYYLYQDPLKGIFRYIPGNYDQVLGIWWDEVRELREGEYRPIFWAVRDVYEWQNPDRSDPLSRRILAIEEFRHVYSYYLEYFIGIAFSPQNLNNYVSEQSLRIAEAAQSDTLRTLDHGFIMNDFYNSLNEGGAPHIQEGLLPFMRMRGETAVTQAEWEDFPPVIRNVKISREKRLNGDIEITMSAMLIANSVAEAKVFSRESSTPIAMLLDDGNGLDQSISDDIYTGTFVIPEGATSSELEIYFTVSDVNFTSNRFPYRTDQFISVGITTDSSPIVINEFMADNDNLIQDESGEYDDWIELYHRGDESVSLAGYYLTDKVDEQLKWALPDTIMAPGDFLLVWADENLNQGNLHADFKLSASGEVIHLYKKIGDAVELQDSISFGAQQTDVAFGRTEDGAAGWGILSNPTPGFSNQTTVSIQEPDVELPSQLTLYPNYPNPFNPETTIRFSLPSSEQVEFKVFSITGQQIMERSLGQLHSGLHSFQVDLSILPTGIYMYTISTSSETRSGNLTLLK